MGKGGKEGWACVRTWQFACFAMDDATLLRPCEASSSSAWGEEDGRRAKPNQSQPALTSASKGLEASNDAALRGMFSAKEFLKESPPPHPWAVNQPSTERCIPNAKARVAAAGIIGKNAIDWWGTGEGEKRRLGGKRAFICSCAAADSCRRGRVEIRQKGSSSAVRRSLVAS